MAKKNTESMSFNLTGILDLDNMTITNDGVAYSLKEKLRKYDGLETNLGCTTQVDIVPLSTE